MKADLSFEEEKIRYPQLSILPFESERGFMATLHQDNGKKVITSGKAGGLIKP